MGRAFSPRFGLGFCAGFRGRCPRLVLIAPSALWRCRTSAVRADICTGPFFPGGCCRLPKKAGPTILPGMRTAFEEWAIVVDALALGEQIIILRKGGISKGRGGFRVDQERFLPWSRVPTE